MASRMVGGTPAPIARSSRFAASFLAAFIASQIAGLVMALAMICVFAFGLQTTFYYPVQVIAGILFGDTALAHATAGMLIAGVLFHQLIAAGWGMLFAICAVLLRVDITISGPILLGVVIGLFSQIFDVYV